MQPPPIPDDEPDRLAAVEALDLLDTPAEERFDRLTRLAVRMFDVPMALVTLVDATRQFFKSGQGLDPKDGFETPRDFAFCAHAIAHPSARAGSAYAPEAQPLVVPDALADPRFAANPLVTGDPSVRFYAGYPLRAKNGQPVGAFCIIDRKPRFPDAAELASLADLAALAEAEIQREVAGRETARLTAEIARLQARASIDGLTRNWSREAILALLDDETLRIAHRGATTDGAAPLTVALIDIDHFKTINDTWGHLVGDDVLVGVSERIRQAVRPGDAVGRLGGDELLVVLFDCGATEAHAVAERVRRRVADRPIETRATPVPVTLSIGLATATGGTGEALVAVADRALYAAKAAGRNVSRAG